MKGKMDVSKNFKVDEKFDAYLNRLAADLDWNLSKTIRQSILIAAPILLAHRRYAESIEMPDEQKQ